MTRPVVQPVHAAAIGEDVAHERERVVVGVDIGGTKVLAGVVDAEGRVSSTALRTTPGRRGVTRQAEDAMVEAILESAAGRPLAGVGVAAAGFVDPAGERVMFAPAPAVAGRAAARPAAGPARLPGAARQRRQLRGPRRGAPRRRAGCGAPP